jgi:leucyl aminopeptidase
MGLDDPEKIKSSDVETAGGKVVNVLKQAGAQKVALALAESDKTPDLECSQFAARLLNGAAMGLYDFDIYKSMSGKQNTDEDDSHSDKIERLSVVTDFHAEAEKAFQPLSMTAEGVYLARDLVNEPPNILYPESFATRIRDELKPLGVDVDIMDDKKIRKMGMGAIEAVGTGSVHPPRLVTMHWRGNSNSSDESPLGFVGKGITFDSGGLSLKPASGMTEMKLDMGGAATVVGAMKAIAKSKLARDVVAVVPLAENMPAHNAYRPCDVITSYSGQTIEIGNTDAEGRLVLADALTYIQEQFQPESIIDLATLTGAIMVALGAEYTGTFVNDDDLWQALEAAAETGNEKIWRMPLDDAYKKAMKGQTGDISNVGNMGRHAGACTAAGFLSCFIEEDRPWAHMDIAATAYISTDKPLTPKGGTGVGVRCLYEYAVANAKARD